MEKIRDATNLNVSIVYSALFAHSLRNVCYEHLLMNEIMERGNTCVLSTEESDAQESTQRTCYFLTYIPKHSPRQMMTETWQTCAHSTDVSYVSKHFVSVHKHSFLFRKRVIPASYCKPSQVNPEAPFLFCSEKPCKSRWTTERS